MTDTTPRAAWTRCNACQTRIPNDRHEIDVHKLNCPHRLQLQIQVLAKRLKGLEDQFASLDEQLAAEPDVDPNAVAPWPDDDESVEQQGEYGDDVLGAEEDEDDEDELPVRPTSLYSPSMGSLT